MELFAIEVNIFGLEFVIFNLYLYLEKRFDFLAFLKLFFRYFSLN